MCKSWCEFIIGLVIALIALFAWDWMYSKWVIVIAAIVLIIHSFMCKSCFAGHYMAMKEQKTETKKKK
ncbi:MAG: hypothetical protein KKD18_01795 [Nanoarchaeota archaeon]|nr:hypothetical protein [Nanoarchaeota archaeon]MBU0977127.1 hypothetical protein [Nanoarchaeota archaeon]